jgi:hypothetical protein
LDRGIRELGAWALRDSGDFRATFLPLRPLPASDNWRSLSWYIVVRKASLTSIKEPDYQLSIAMFDTFAVVTLASSGDSSILAMLEARGTTPSADVRQALPTSIPMKYDTCITTHLEMLNKVKEEVQFSPFSPFRDPEPIILDRDFEYSFYTYNFAGSVYLSFATPTDSYRLTWLANKLDRMLAVVQMIVHQKH